MPPLRRHAVLRIALDDLREATDVLVKDIADSQEVKGVAEWLRGAIDEAHLDGQEEERGAVENGRAALPA